MQFKMCSNGCQTLKIDKTFTMKSLKKFDATKNVLKWSSNFENWQNFHNENDHQLLAVVSKNKQLHDFTL